MVAVDLVGFRLLRSSFHTWLFTGAPARPKPHQSGSLGRYIYMQPRRACLALMVLSAPLSTALLVTSVRSHRSRPLHMSEDVPMDVHGFSVSPTGFVALLTNGKDRLLPLQVNDVDVETVVSAEALVLLQLLQCIDMGGPCLPPERLQQRLSEDGVQLDGAIWKLTRVLIDGQASDSVEFKLTAQMCDDGANAGVITTAACPTAFEAVALSMRYKASLAASETLLDAIGLDGLEAAVRYPKAFTWRDAKQQDERVRKDFANKLSEASGAPVAPSTPVNANRPDTRALYEKALAIAIDKADKSAEAKIRAALAALPDES